MEEAVGTHHPLRVFSGSANRTLAGQVVQHLEALRVAYKAAYPEDHSAGINEPVMLGRCTTKCFPDTETHVTIDQVVRDQDVYIIQPCSPPVNNHLMELLLYVDAFRRASAHEITAVIPYFPYARQERMAKGREAISARVVATMLEALRVGRVIYFDVHVAATQGFFNVPVDPLTALPALAGYFMKPEFQDAAIVAPDVGRAKFASRYAEHLKLPLVVMHKRREDDGKTKVTHVVGDIKDKIPIVIDDVIAGGSVLTQLDELVRVGARPEVYLAITHGVLLPKALDALANPLIKRLVISDTIEQPPAVQSHPKIAIVSVAELLAKVIWRIHSGASISDLIEKE